MGLPVDFGGDQNVRYFCAKQLHATVINHDVDVVEYLGSFCMSHYTVCRKCSFKKKYQESDFANMQQPSRVNVELFMECEAIIKEQLNGKLNTLHSFYVMLHTCLK